MNQLFQTQFQELNSLIDRKQTTQGVWIQCRGNLLILDVEGSDSLNRQSEQNFEKFVDLFALSISDIIIINIWTTDVGRLSSSQLQLLETILEHQIKIWGSQYRKSIIFILRDFNFQSENQQAITHQLTKHVNNAWARINAPVQFKDVFDFTVFCLPNFIYCKQAFNESIIELRRLIQGINLKNKNIPLRSFDLYCAQIWKTITTRQELNLPNTRILIALFKCQEFIELSLEKLKNNQIDFLQKDDQLSILTKQYFEQLSDYDQSIVKEKHQYLQSQFQQIYFNQALQFIEKEKKKIFQNIKNQLQNLVTTLPHNDTSLNSIQTIQKDSLIQLDISLDLMKKIFTQQQIQDFQTQFKEQLNFFIDSYKQTLLIQFKQKLIDQLSQQLKTKFKEILKKFESDLFVECNTQSRVSLNQTRLQVNTLFKELQITDNEQLQGQFFLEIDERAKKILNEAMQNLSHFAENKLKSSFQLDSSGNSNKWQSMSEDEIRQLNREVLKSVIITLNSISILPPQEITDIANRVNREAAKLLEYALLSKNQKGKPFYLRWLLLFILYLVFNLFFSKLFGSFVCLVFFMTLTVFFWKKHVLDRMEQIILFFMSGLKNY